MQAVRGKLDRTRAALPSTGHEIVLPNLIIIGAPRSGTSALHYYLNLHPEISMSRVKELNYFVEERNWGRGLNRYKAPFDQPIKVRGESLPIYSRYPAFSDVPERMHALIPDAWLVQIVRDPIDRILSHYVMTLSIGMTTLDLADALADFDGNILVDQSRYSMQLERSLAYYPDSQILILTQEQLLHQRG